MGGCTIQEAKDNLTVDEVDAWRQYRNAHGPMAMHIRIEQHLATVCMLIASAAGLKKNTDQPFTTDDFIIYAQKTLPKPLDEITDFGEFLSAIK